MGKRLSRHMRTLMVWLLGVALSLSAASPVLAQSGEVVGGGIGGAIGGLIGNHLGKGRGKVIATLLGVGAGAFVGARIGKGLSKRDKEQVSTSTSETLATGQSRTWTGNKAGVRGKTELAATDRRKAAVEVPVLKERVTTLPPLDFINANYITVRKESVRGGPGLDYRRVADLKKGDIVSVTGKVQSQPWYLVAQNGVGVGFVQEASVKPTAEQPTQTANISGTVETKTTQMERTCRTVKQTVVQNGSEQTENVTACQTANGWEVI